MRSTGLGVVVGLAAVSAVLIIGSAGILLDRAVFHEQPQQPAPTQSQFPDYQEARIAEHIKRAGFAAAMQTDLAEANKGRQGLTPPPWMLLARYVDVLERRVAELEREKAQKGK